MRGGGGGKKEGRSEKGQRKGKLIGREKGESRGIPVNSHKESGR